MAEFKRVVITQKGQALMAKLMAGSGTTHFTAIKVSDSNFNDDQLEGLTSIGNVRQTIEISKVDRTNNVSAEVEGAVSNTNLTAGYYMRTLGLYAQDPDEGEILYAVTVASQAGYMPPFNGKTTSGAFFRITTTIGNADNLNIQVNPSAVATIGEINDLQKQIDAIKGNLNVKVIRGFNIETDQPDNPSTENVNNPWIVDQATLKGFADAHKDVRNHTDYRYPTAQTYNTAIDLNSAPYLDTGIYRFGNCPLKNGPYADTNSPHWGYINVIKYDDNVVFQAIFGGNEFYGRMVSLANNSYPSWTKFATTDQVANAIDSAMKQVDSGLGNRVKVLENSAFVPYQQFTNADDARLWSEKTHGLAEVIDS